MAALGAVVYLAAYGSLRTGLENAGMNAAAEATSVGEGWTNSPAVLARFGQQYFPMLSLHAFDGATPKPVRVEVFATTQNGIEQHYDRLEGYPEFYNRSRIGVILDDGREVEAWIYHIEDATRRGQIVDSGDWKEFRVSQRAQTT
eukprot:TRINITY_DN22135_c0_g1_i1.p1 TRINITY_DN22135_c0_g1~~TRINITY_DN22135_c0_g1_i1.p1  ORF type:complete len:155 (-),score=17.68 TRINITY_DN22135_c0_g1_i1:8-442(-)